MSEDDLTPTPENLARDLLADLERALDNYGPNWGPTSNAANIAFGQWAADVLPAALRRAIAAEAALREGKPA